MSNLRDDRPSDKQDSRSFTPTWADWEEAKAIDLPGGPTPHLALRVWTHAIAFVLNDPPDSEEEKINLHNPTRSLLAALAYGERCQGEMAVWDWFIQSAIDDARDAFDDESAG